eukprot:GHVL01002759.1.p1 GENE.GHVL01002759.1~~GHVL01002759.1.p1  ORF type:complete len:455 (-),score=102.26 GHVL01002759.1:193-1557(-)
MNKIILYLYLYIYLDGKNIYLYLYICYNFTQSVTRTELFCIAVWRMELMEEALEAKNWHNVEVRSRNKENVIEEMKTWPTFLTVSEETDDSTNELWRNTFPGIEKKKPPIQLQNTLNSQLKTIVEEAAPNVEATTQNDVEVTTQNDDLEFVFEEIKRWISGITKRDWNQDFVKNCSSNDEIYHKMIYVLMKEIAIMRHNRSGDLKNSTMTKREYMLLKLLELVFRWVDSRKVFETYWDFNSRYLIKFREFSEIRTAWKKKSEDIDDYHKKRKKYENEDPKKNELDPSIIHMRAHFKIVAAANKFEEGADLAIDFMGKTSNILLERLIFQSQKRLVEHLMGEKSNNPVETSDDIQEIYGMDPKEVLDDIQEIYGMDPKEVLGMDPKEVLEQLLKYHGIQFELLGRQISDLEKIVDSDALRDNREKERVYLKDYFKYIYKHIYIYIFIFIYIHIYI